MAVAAAGIFPDHVAYFNEAACVFDHPDEIGWSGGTRCGPLWLDDSNVDWGQALGQLRNWRKAHPDARTMHLAYFGSFPPEAYGLDFEKIGAAQLGTGNPAPGLYVVSAHLVARYSDSWLRTTAPKEIVGHSLYVYDVPLLPEPHHAAPQ